MGRMGLVSPTFISGGPGPHFYMSKNAQISLNNAISVGSIVKVNCLMKEMLKILAAFCQYYL